MAHLQKYKSIRPLNKSVMIRIDDQLFMAIMAYAQKQTDTELLNCPEMVRAVMAAVCLDKTFVHISNQNILQTGMTYYTESDIEGYESQIETLKSRVSEYANELNMRDVRLKNMAEQHQVEVAILKAKIQSNVGNYNQPSQDQNQSGSNQSGSNQSGLELSEYGMNKPAIEPIALNMEEIIQDKFLEVVGNQLVIEYFNQQTKLNQRFGISGFNGVFKVVEEIPNSLLEHHPLVVYWKKRVGQFENAVVNATEAFFQQDHTVQQMSQNEQLALNALIKREQMLWWLITHFTTIRGFDHKYCNYLRTYAKLGVFIFSLSMIKFLSGSNLT